MCFKTRRDLQIMEGKGTVTVHIKQTGMRYLHNVYFILRVISKPKHRVIHEEWAFGSLRRKNPCNYG